MAVLKNRAKMSTSTTGTGTITLGSAEDGYQSFADAGVANADVVRYVIEDGSNWEIGTGTYTATGTTLSRTVSESSNSDAAINLSGSATVFIGATAEDIPALYADNPSSATDPVASGTNAVAIGDNAVAAGSYSASLGYRANANGNRAIALGYAYTSGADAATISTGTNSSSYGALASRAIAIGWRSKAAFSDSFAIGDTATTSAINQIALGGTTDTVKISGTYTLPTSDGTNGQVLTTDGSGAVTFADAGGGGGADLFAENYDGTSTLPSATGTNAVAIGVNASAGGAESFVAGRSATDNSNQDAVVIGRFASASSNETVAVGEQADAGGLRSVALGYLADANGANSISVGPNSQAYSQYAIGIGANVQANADYSTAIGSGSGGSNPARAQGNGAMALGGSYASGTDSFAAAITNNTSSYGASGTSGIAIGYQAKASGAYSFALDYQSQATGLASRAFGYQALSSGTNSMALGRNANATGVYSYALAWSKSATNGKLTYGSGQFGAVGDAQQGTFVLRLTTTDATPKTLITDTAGAGTTTNQVILPNNSAYSFSGTIIARESAAAGSDYASWEIKGALLRDANAASTVLGNGIQNKLYATSGASAWAIALSADTTKGGLKIEVTGGASTNIRWVATVNTSEVTYA